MQNIMPPEVPRRFTRQKESFFKRLFSKKPAIEPAKPALAKAVDADKELFNELPPLPDLNFPDLNVNQPITEVKEPLNVQTIEPIITYTPDTSMDDQKSSKKLLGKGKGKGLKKKFEPIDAGKVFSWADSIKEQQSAIYDSNKSNEAVKIIEKADAHLDDKKPLMKNKLMTFPDKAPEVVTEQINIPEVTHEPIMANPQDKKLFDGIDKDHQRLRKKVESAISSGKVQQRKEFLELLKQYDEKIEQKIENKDQEFRVKRKKLVDMSNMANEKLNDLKKLQKDLDVMNKKLKDKETMLDSIINKQVETQLAKRTDKERKILRQELQATIAMNAKLKKQLEYFEKHKVVAKSKNEELIDDYKDKMTSMQELYEKKLAELQKEREEFERKRRESTELLNKASDIHNELQKVISLNNNIDQKKNFITQKVDEERELRNAIDNTEVRLAKEREALDSKIFNKYIEWKLANRDDTSELANLFQNPRTDEMSKQITRCRSLIGQGKIIEAKRVYNAIKNGFDSLSNDNKDMFYTAVRELYNDIQLMGLQH